MINKLKKLDDSFIEYAGDILADTNYGLTGSQIIKLFNGYAMAFSKIIPYGRSASEAPNKRTALKENLRAFELKEQLQIIRELCDNPKIRGREEVQEIKFKLFVRYKEQINSNLYEEIKKSNISVENQWLKNYSRSLKQYKSAMQKYRAGVFSRNTLDDMRLAFELLVKDLFNSNATLENQISAIGKMLKAAGATKELTNVVPHIINLYTKYQNNNVKHNDCVKDSEVEMVIDLTITIMKYLIKQKSNIQ